MSQTFRNITYLSDRGGTGVWRCIWPLNSVNCISQNVSVQADYSQTPILDKNFYTGINRVTVQRWISDAQENLFTKWLKPVMDMNSGYLFYEEDDDMFDGTLLNESKREYLEKKYGNLRDASIPLYNRGRKAFEGQKVQQNIKNMLNAADFVTVTTDYLKEFYHDVYDVPLENIIAVPNLLPRYLFDDRFDPAAKLDQFRKLKSKPRIGIVSSLSHYNVDNVRIDKDGNAVRMQKMPDGSEKWINELGAEVKFEDTQKITDDFDDIAECVRSTVDDFQWVMFGFTPPQIEDLAKAGKIECHGGIQIMNYPSRLEQLKLQAIVAPIKKMPFNYSKSFIKTMETAAIGVPLYATNCLPYNRVMPKERLFDSSDDLKQKLLKLKFSSANIYNDIITQQWKWLNSPCVEGDFELKNFWLEDNINIYVDMMRLKTKTLAVPFSGFAAQYEKAQAEKAKNTIYSDEEVLITK